ncbi:hypothetical protein [Actinoplanes sp. NPDC049265]|uniref:hypothetical protein n=1 Tax=Actinoplanes sp. NPDC049265 TaxID=3363902 RepID=UPI0037117A72
MGRRWWTLPVWLLVVAAASAPAPAPARPFDVAVAAARLDDLHRRIYGDLEEVRAAERLNFHRIEGGIAACMRAHSRPYRMPPFASFYRDFTDADLGYGTGRMSLIDSLTAGPRRYVLNERAYARLPHPKVRRQDMAVFQGCADRFGGQGYTSVPPPGGWNAVPDVSDILLAVVRDPGVAAAMRDYPGCMKVKYGYAVGVREDFLMPGVDMDARYAADADCRRPAYLLAMRIVDQRLGPWEAEHRTRLDAIRRGWRERVELARRLG